MDEATEAHGYRIRFEFDNTGGASAGEVRADQVILDTEQRFGLSATLILRMSA
jgi:hypothetical protein